MTNLDSPVVETAYCANGEETAMELNDVLITPVLTTRKTRQANVFTERSGLDLVARRTSYGRKAVLEALCEFALETCGADAAGISVKYESADGAGFAWEVLAGELKKQAAGNVPLDSPCGVCLERGTPQLFSHPERHYKWMHEAGFVVPEVLVVPMYSARRTPFGTLWIISNTDDSHFDSEDARIMQAVGKHASAALQVQAKNQH
jgi:GAF domain-containing protein